MQLKPGEIECDHCKDSNDALDKKLKEKPWITTRDYIWCSKCKGTRKLDWIENIVGKIQQRDLWPFHWLGPSDKDPVNACVGSGYYNNVLKKSLVFNGSEWEEIDK